MSVMTRDQLRVDIALMLGEDATTVGVTDNLMDLGLDSMRAMNLALRWEEQGVPLDFTDLAEAPTLNDLWDLLRVRQEGVQP